MYWVCAAAAGNLVSFENYLLGPRPPMPAGVFVREFIIFAGTFFAGVLKSEIWDGCLNPKFYALRKASGDSPPPNDRSERLSVTLNAGGARVLF